MNNLKIGDLVQYDGKTCLLTEIRNKEKDNIEYILLSNEGFYNLGKYQVNCIKVLK